MKDKLLAVLNLVFFLAHVTVSFLTQRKLFSAMDVGEVSNKYDTVFTPAGITFSIWGLIYIALLVFCIYHLYKVFTKPAEDQANTDLKAIGWLFIINNISTGLWLIVWVNEMLFFSVILILIQLISLVLISIRAHISNPDRPMSTRIFTQFPLSIYFGWISIATIANISAYLKSVNWQGMGISDSLWTIIMIGVATLLTLFIVLVRRNFPYGLVVLWALYGIILKRNQVDPIFYESVVNAAWAAFVVIVIALIIRLFKKQAPDESLVSI